MNKMEKSYFNSINIATGKSTKIKDLIFELADLIGTKKQIQFVKSIEFQNDIDHVACIKKMQDLYKWKPSITLTEGLKEALIRNEKNEIKKQIFSLVKRYYEHPADKNKYEIAISDLFYNHKENAALDALLEGWISQGKKVRNFERDFSKKVGMGFGIATNSGSSVNLVALNALKSRFDIKDGGSGNRACINFCNSFYANNSGWINSCLC